MGIIYKYELKKLLNNKIILITAGILCLVVIAWGIFNSVVSTNSKLDGVVLTRYAYNQISKEYQNELSGRKIDSILLQEMRKAHETHMKTGDYSNLVAYEDVFLFVGEIIDSYSTPEVLSIDENELYQQFLNKMLIDSSNGIYNKNEVEYWNKAAEEIAASAVIYRGDFSGWQKIISFFEVLIYMETLFVAIALSTTFPLEHVRKTDQLIYASKYGKSKQYWAEIFAGLTVAIGFVVIFSSLYIGVVALVYGLDGFDTAIQFIILRPFRLSVGGCTLILLSLSLVATFTNAIISMVISKLTKSSLATISIFAGILIMTLFVQDVPENLRPLFELWYLIPSNMVSLEGAFRYNLLTIFGHNFLSYQIAPIVLLLFSFGFVLIGKITHEKVSNRI